MMNQSKKSKMPNFNVKYYNMKSIIPNTSNQKLIPNYNTDIRRSKEEFEIPLQDEGTFRPVGIYKDPDSPLQKKFHTISLKN